MARRLSLLLVLAIGGSLAIVPAASAGGGCHAGSVLGMTSSDETHVAIAKCAFIDTVTYVDPGERVTWFNKDVFDHTVTGAGQSWGDETFLAQGDRVSYTFDDEGVYPYFCALHPAMVGAVVVGDGQNEAVVEAGEAAITKKHDAAPAGATKSDTPDSGGGSAAVTALSLVAALGVVFIAGRYALARRARASTAA